MLQILKKLSIFDAILLLIGLVLVLFSLCAIFSEVPAHEYLSDWIVWKFLCFIPLFFGIFFLYIFFDINEDFLEEEDLD